jgi:hypothetical protein
LSEALRPSWHESREAGRVRRHTEILRGLARELSNDPARPDRPKTAQEAQARFEAHLDDLVELTPRSGLAAPTGAFIDVLIERYSRYGAHLFLCFDDDRIPSTSNDLEGFFGESKQQLRHALGSGSTSNSVVSNLGADALIAYHQLRQAGAMDELLGGSFSSEAFLSARADLATREAPQIRQRSMVRHLERHLNRLDELWFHPDPPRAHSPRIGGADDDALVAPSPQPSPRGEGAPSATLLLPPTACSILHKEPHSRQEKRPGCIERAAGANA